MHLLTLTTLFFAISSFASSSASLVQLEAIQLNEIVKTLEAPKQAYETKIVKLANPLNRPNLKLASLKK